MSDVLNLPNSIWPNGIKVDDEGYAVFYPLGTNKIEVPTDSSSWPTGDKLVSPFVYQNDRLVGFCDTMAMTVSGNTTITMPYEHIEADFASISEGKLTVNAPNAVVKKFMWSVVDSSDNDNGNDNVIVTLKYKGCKTVKDVKAVDSKYKTTDIVDGVWSEGLGDLEDGNSMFYECGNLTSFSSDLSSLTNGNWMFGYTNLKSFSSDLSSLKKARSMFYGCPKLTSFSSNLPSLTDGYYMFNGCKLDAPSVKNIIDTINTYSANLLLGVGCNYTTEDKDLFAQEAGYADMTSLLAALQSKGWTANAQYNGRPTTTYSLRRPSEDTLPVFAKLEEVEEYPDYTSIDEAKKYRLDWFHETTGSTDGYTQFNSLEEAIEHFNIKPIERN